MDDSSYGVHAPYDTPPPNKPQNAAAHTRVYQACIPCRRRKVRCELGSVDNPNDPPCARCRRESKDCFFSSTRRKKKHAEGEEENALDSGNETYIKAHNPRKRLRKASNDLQKYESEEDEPRTPGGSIGRPQPLRRPAAPQPVQYREEDHKASEQTVGLLQATEVHGGHDALKLLFQAAAVKEAGTRNGITGISPASMPSASPMMDRTNGYHNGAKTISQHDPALRRSISEAIPSTSSDNTVAYAAALKAWSRFRFVRTGWFTAKEAIEYIQYFYQHLAPLTPVPLPEYNSYASHEKLLTQEPMLTVTMLLIASRHMELAGPGAVSRPYSIHQKLWTYLSGMIDRLVWGQEQFGGGFCGAGAEAGCDVNPLSRKGLRTLGTVESMVLLTEWHPRAMHFPPDETDEELMLPEANELPSTPNLTTNDNLPKGIGGQRMDTWLEPCWRSDRMCWMLLGLSMTLAFEIGVFDASEWERHAQSADGKPLSAANMRAYNKRRGHVKDLLLIYVSQTSGRTGLTSMLPSNYSKPEDSRLYERNSGQLKDTQDTTLHFWLRMAALMREGTTALFANKVQTRNLIRSGAYKTALNQLQPGLHEWRDDFDRSGSIPSYMRYILEIEYEYCRVYLNSLALQAVAERCANMNEHPLQFADPPVEVVRSAAGPDGMRSDVAIPPQTLARRLEGDRGYLLEVGDAARNLLTVVVEGLYPGGYLRHAPVRTYFRIVSVAVMLLKSFSLGASESDVRDSLALMDRTVIALRECVVDDVHVASRFAEFLDTMTQSVKPRLVRIAHDGRPGKSRRASIQDTPQALQSNHNNAQDGLPAPQQHGPIDAAQTQQQWSYNNGVSALNGSFATDDPLYGISNSPYDLMGPDNNFSIMPPPSFEYQSPNTRSNQNLSATSVNMNYDPYGNSHFANDVSMQDWFALPLDPLINMTGADVNQTMYGPELGGQDMLELLLSTNNY